VSPTCALLALAAGVGGTATLAVGQVGVSLDAAAAHVDYDGFLPSAAYSVSPAILVRGRPVEARFAATYLVFASGNASAQVLATVASRGVRVGRWRAHVAATGGMSGYERVARSGHALFSAAATRGWPRWAAWLEGGGGWADGGGAPRPAWIAGGGLRHRLGALVLSSTITAAGVGDTSYVDLGTAAGLALGPWRLDGTLGARLPSHGGGEGVYGEATAVLAASNRVGLFIGGGRYPSDPVRGSIAGNYLSGGVRLAAGGRPRARPAVPRVDVATASASGASSLFMTRLNVRPTGDSVALRVIAPEASIVEVMGGFTAWQPVALQPVGSGVWERRFRLVPGLHRLNVRLDRGAWEVPSGATPLSDGFGGTVGTFVVP
jgi:hypothetical protein